MTGSILTIEDHEPTAELIETVLGRAGFDVLGCRDGRSGLRLIHERRPGAVILDVGLPELDGWQVLERVRDISDVPVLMLTGSVLRTDVVRGLQAGADDYLTKPFDNGELVARVRALLRRHRRAEDETGGTLIDGPLEVGLASRSVTLDGEAIAMTPTEFRLLVVLMQHPGQVLSADQLLELAWSDPTGSAPERVKFAIHRLRRRLGWDADRSPVEAVRGFGYRYRPARRVP